MFIFIRALFFVHYIVACVVAHVNISTETWIHAQAFGTWKNNVFSSSTIKPYNSSHFTGINKPRILMIGDSINRNALQYYCNSVNSKPYAYTNCTGLGGHYACSTKNVDLASFFIFGAALYEFSEDLGRSRHTCAIMGHGTLDRIRNHLLPSIKNVFGNNDADIIVINAMRWTLNDIKYKKSSFEAPLFLNFAQEYMYNMSVIICEVIILSPSSIIMLQKLPFKVHHKYAVHAINKLLDILSIQHNIGG